MAKPPISLQKEALTKTTVDIVEAESRLSELVERAARGEEILITRRGEQVARLMPPQARDAVDQARSVSARIRRSRSGQTLGGSASVRDLIDEGRR